MGLRCLLGHDFGEPELEREREEDGNEMVVTIREVKTCERCGTERVLSENKEVTSIRSASDVGLEGGSGATDAPADEVGAGTGVDAGRGANAGREAAGAGVDAGGDREGGAPGAGATEGVDASPGSVDAADSGRAADAADDRGEGDAPDATAFVESAEGGESFEPPQSADEDDGVILDDDSTGDDRSGGGREPPAPEPDAELDNPSTDVDVTADAIEADEAAEDDAEFIDAEEDAAATTDDGPVPWPEHDDVAPAESGGSAQRDWPTPSGEDEGFDAEPSDGTRADVSFGGSLTPGGNEAAAGGASGRSGANAANGASGAAENGEAAYLGGDDVDEAFAGAEAHAVELETPAPDVNTEYYCPECETTWPASESSMRAGDICRECQRGYVGEREL